MLIVAQAPSRTLAKKSITVPELFALDHGFFLYESRD
jgi:hypothetical protein